MPKNGSHIGYSLFPSVCSDSCFVEILTCGVSSIIQCKCVDYFFWRDCGKRLEEGPYATSEQIVMHVNGKHCSLWEVLKG